MKIQLAILGLGQIGSSVGMALEKYKESIHRIGHDKSREAITFAKENDVVDKISLTLSNAVKNADIVLLALPFHEIHSVLEHIGQDLKEGALLIDTSPLKVPVLAWIEETLPEQANYVGFTPVIKAAYLEECEYGSQVAHADLFEDSLMGLISGRKANEKSINMAINLAQLLGATPYFSDAAEMDGLMSTTTILPQLLAAALLKNSLDSPGWREAKKVAGKAFSQLTNSFGQDDLPDALASAVINNQENSTRLINDLIRELVEIRELIETSGQKELEENFTKSQQGR
ncbi:MAG: prephenate dehydrogenase, partial [Chloroflexi bacterium]|nr:prephenate dehydrogenase [Chloroflexota bacterium]